MTTRKLSSDLIVRVLLLSFQSLGFVQGSVKFYFRRRTMVNPRHLKRLSQKAEEKLFCETQNELTQGQNKLASEETK